MGASRQDHTAARALPGLGLRFRPWCIVHGMGVILEPVVRPRFRDQGNCLTALQKIDRIAICRFTPAIDPGRLHCTSSRYVLAALPVVDVLHHIAHGSDRCALLRVPQSQAPWRKLKRTRLPRDNHEDQSRKETAARGEGSVTPLVCASEQDERCPGSQTWYFQATLCASNCVIAQTFRARQSSTQGRAVSLRYVDAQLRDQPCRTRSYDGTPSHARAGES